MENIPAFNADIMYALICLCVIASVCSAAAWLWKPFINLDIGRAKIRPFGQYGWPLEPFCGGVAMAYRAMSAPHYEKGEATFIIFWIPLSAVCFFGLFMLFFHRTADSPRGPGA